MRHLWIGLLLLPLCACGSFEDKVQRAAQQDHAWRNINGSPWSQYPEVQTTFTTADDRIITLRRHPVLGNPILCVEPAPDVADALSSASAVTATGGSTTIKGSLSISGSATDAVSELAGRSTALLGLRDGLFQACEAYANGIIGQEAYALILSHYGQLMTTLFLGQDLSEAAKTPAASAASAAKPAAPAAAATTTTTTTTKTAEETAPLVSTAPKPAKNATPLEPEMVSDLSSIKAHLIPLSGDFIGGYGQLKKVAGAGAGAGAAAGKPADPGTVTPVSSASTVALAIVRMNEDYMQISPASAIFVTCINEHDPTRLSVPINTVAGQVSSAMAPEALEDGLQTCVKMLTDYYTAAANGADKSLVKPETGLTK